MNSTVMKQTPHVVQKNGHQRRRSVLSNHLGQSRHCTQCWPIAIAVALNVHKYPLLDDMCHWVRLDVHHLPNQRA